MHCVIFIHDFHYARIHRKIMNDDVALLCDRNKLDLPFSSP